ncbi:MAG TPA: non-canonical purine NTP pyrophosphatase [Candidatus Limnocylindria bacterium]|nr:non-canonical purine NTP pyrophosphatase [Candidatus Limnocylindria bacterium]
MSDLLLGTTNAGKQREFARLLDGIPGRLVFPQQIGIDLDVPEPHGSYAENAAAKAEAYCRASGLLTLADDSGIEVAALDWGPGVTTARFGGQNVADRVALLLEAVGDSPDRAARFVCVLVLGVPDAAGGAPRLETFSGTVEGRLATERRGSGGFGYDPVFLLPSGRTTAELPDAEKDRISHRGRAVQAAMPRLRELLAAAPAAAGDR